MALGTPQASVGTGLATGALALIFMDGTIPNLSDVRAAEPENQDVNGAARGSLWIATGIVAGVALITQDATVFVIGGAVVLARYWATMHANQVNPLSGLASMDMTPGGYTEAEPSNNGYMDVAPFAPAA